MYFLILLISLLDWTYAKDVAPVNSVPMRIVNNAGSPIELFWINIYENPNTLVKQSSKPIRNSSDISINSYNTHQFVVKFLDPKRPTTGGNFTKGPRDEVITITLDESSNNLEVKQTTKFDEVMDTINEATIACSSLRDTAFSKCVADGVIDDVTRMTDSKSRLTKYRDVISSRLRNYTCADETMETSEPENSHQVRIGPKTYNVDVMLDMKNAKIWVVEDFITPEECAVLENHGKPLLHRATVAAEDGSSIVSEHRKANQASYNFHQQNFGRDPLWPLFNRVLSMTNQHTDYNLKPDGQEDFTIIQYGVDDQYTPHCDGQCDNSVYNMGGRVATAVLYCKVPERGGATTFTKADIFVKPKAGMATFFSYRGPDGRVDEGYTEHSGCPVLEGEKWISTVWMRDGVSKEEPWTMFDPSGIKMLTSEEYAELGVDDSAEGEEFESSANDEL